MAIFGNEKEWESKVKSLEEKLKNADNKYNELNDTLEVVKLELQDKDDKIKNSGLEIMELRGDNKTLTAIIKDKEVTIDNLTMENKKLKQVMSDNNIKLDKFVKLNSNSLVDELLIDNVIGISKLTKTNSAINFDLFLKYEINGNNSLKFSFSPDGADIKNMHEANILAEKEYNRIKNSIK